MIAASVLCLSGCVSDLVIFTVSQAAFMWVAKPLPLWMNPIKRWMKKLKRRITSSTTPNTIAKSLRLIPQLHRQHHRHRESEPVYPPNLQRLFLQGQTHQTKYPLAPEKVQINPKSLLSQLNLTPGPSPGPADISSGEFGLAGISVGDWGGYTGSDSGAGGAAGGVAGSGEGLAMVLGG